MPLASPEIRPFASDPYFLKFPGIHSYPVEYDLQSTLKPDFVTEGLAVIAARLTTGQQSLSGLEVGGGCGPFLSVFARNSSSSTQLHLESVDISQASIPYAKYNIARALDLHNNTSDSMDVRREDWSVALSRGRKYDVIYFNPPYLPYGEEVRDEMRNAPEQAIYVRDSSDGLDHYSDLFPGLRESIRQGGLIVVRAPNDDERFVKVRAMAEAAFEDQRSGFTIHAAVINSEMGERDGRGLIIEAASSLASEYSMESVNHIGGYIVQKSIPSISSQKVFV